MTVKRESRPDTIDRAILRFTQNIPQGVTIPALHHEVCPGRREGFVRYRIATLQRAGLVRCENFLGRILIFPAEEEKIARAVDL